MFLVDMQAETVLGLASVGTAAGACELRGT